LRSGIEAESHSEKDAYARCFSRASISDGYEGAKGKVIRAVRLAWEFPWCGAFLPHSWAGIRETL